MKSKLDIILDKFYKTKDLLIIKANAEYLKEVSLEIQKSQNEVALAFSNQYSNTSEPYDFYKRITIFRQFGVEVWFLHDEDCTEPDIKSYALNENT
jgi:hypothetical protein